MARENQNYVVEFSSRDRIGQKRMYYDVVSAPTKKSIREKYRRGGIENIWTQEQFEQLSDEYRYYINKKLYGRIDSLTQA